MKLLRACILPLGAAWFLALAGSSLSTIATLGGWVSRPPSSRNATPARPEVEENILVVGQRPPALSALGGLPAGHPPVAPAKPGAQAHARRKPAACHLSQARPDAKIGADVWKLPHRHSTLAKPHPSSM